MKARAAVAMTYATIQRGRKPEEQREIDAILGDPWAQRILADDQEAAWAAIEAM